MEKTVDGATLNGLRTATEPYISMAENLLVHRTLFQEEVVELWDATIEGMLESSGEPRDKLLKFGMKLMGLQHTGGGSDLKREQLFMLIVDPAGQTAPELAMEIASHTSGQDISMFYDDGDRKRYIKLAKHCLVKLQEKGGEETVRQVSGILKRLRVQSEKEGAMKDLQKMLGGEYQDNTSPQAMYVEMTYSAVGKALSIEAGVEPTKEDRITVLQLVKFAEMPEEIRELFSSDSDQGNLERIMRSVENALLHVLTTGDKRLKQQTADALVLRGSERVEQILEKIAQREGRETETGAIVSCMLRGIKEKKGMLPATIPKPAGGDKAVQSAKEPTTI